VIDVERCHGFEDLQDVLSMCRCENYEKDCVLCQEAFEAGAFHIVGIFF
jgi:hypothetical protein